MKINVSRILKDVYSSIEAEGEVKIPLIHYNREDITVNAPIKVKALITNTGDNLQITGHIQADMILKCSRCLKDFNHVFNTDFEEEISNKVDTEDIIYFEGDTVDLTDIVVNNLLLALPMKFLCSEECKGLCPCCGRDINSSKCDCTDENLDPRLTVLKDLLKAD